MTNPYPYIALTDGTTTITIASGSVPSNYPLTGDWAPVIAGRRLTTLGGYGVFNDVTETLSINVHGTSGIDVLRRVVAAAALLDQAQAWYDGASVAAVRMQYAPQYAAIANAGTPFEAILIGRPSRDQPDAGIAVAPNFNALIPAYEAEDVQLSFRRTGLWLSPPVGTLATATLYGGTGITSATLASGSAVHTALPAQMLWDGAIPTPSPMGLTWRAPAQFTNRGAYIFIGMDTEDAQALRLTVGADLYSDGVLGIEADTVRRAPTGSVAVRSTTTTGTTAFDVAAVGELIAYEKAQQVAMYALVRQSSTLDVWQVRGGPWDGSTYLFPTTTASVTISTTLAGTNPQVIYLGQFQTVPGKGIGMEIARATVTAATTGTARLYISGFIAVSLENSAGRVVTIPRVPRPALGDDVPNTLRYITINHPEMLRTPEPRVDSRLQPGDAFGGTATGITYAGDAALTATSATVTMVVWLNQAAEDGIGVWGYGMTGGGTGVGTLSWWAAAVRRGYRIPE